jgi:HSP20 family protein
MKGIMMKKDIEVKKDRTMQKTYNPLAEYDRLGESFFGERFPTLLGDWPMLSRQSAANIREQDDAFILNANLPGIPKEDIQVQVSGNQLTIHAEHRNESGDESSESGYHREYRTYHQSFNLPSNVEADQVEAFCENGRLEIFLPKNAVEQKRKIEIQSGKENFKQRRLDKKNEAKEKH